MSNDGDASHNSRSPTESNEDTKTGQFTAVNNTSASSNSHNHNGHSSHASNGTSNGAPISLFGGPSNPAPSPLLPPPPPPARDSANTTNSTSTSNSPQLTHPATDDPWQHRPRADSIDAATAQKRKRSPEELNHSQRAVTPTTQTQHHHLAAHVAAMGGNEPDHGTMPFPQLPSTRPDSQEREHSHYSMDDHRGMNDDGSRMHEGSPQPGGVQGDPKRRKRVFSNRTKTGCITCRRRKKKCDEGKPECSNCKRGGFVCEGYSGKVSWQKPPGKSGSSTTTTATTTPAGAPITIQSKPGHSASNSTSPTPVHSRPATMPPQTLPRLPLDDHPYRPRAAIDDSKPSPAEESLSPNSVGRQQQQPQQQQQQPTHQSAYSSHPTPIHESYASTPHSGPPTVPQTSSSSITTPGGTRRVSFSQAALSAASGGSGPRPKSEKEKMINSELYHASAPELVAEREACKAACWRYNNAASNPNLGISDAEKGRLLLDVLRPGRNWEIVNTTPEAQGGITYISDGGYHSDIENVTVDAPFTCSYGYNIRLGKNVYIEFGCTILDSCAVTIKARTILSPNVSIYSATHPIDPRKRNGPRGPEMAKPVLIEEDCWLGGNVIVLGGITIGKGSVVGAGSVVTRDVPPFTVVAGNPARVIRGIYQNNVDM